jgi:Fe-S cluster biogenesis protein NfuA
MAMQIDTEFTPNPNSLKFNVGRPILEKGSLFFMNSDEAKSAPLANALFQVPSVQEVFVGRDFVTVTRLPETETWGAIIPAVTIILQEHLSMGQMLDSAAERTSTGTDEDSADIERRICQVLDEKIRPAVARDGGDIVFHGFKDGVVTLHLQGACSSCPSSIATLKSGVERILCEAVPEVKEVIQA